MPSLFNQPILVSADIEDYAIANMTGRGKIRFDLSPTIPINCPTADVRVPRPERSLGVLTAGRLPKRV